MYHHYKGSQSCGIFVQLLSKNKTYATYTNTKYFHRSNSRTTIMRLLNIGYCIELIFKIKKKRLSRHSLFVKKYIICSSTIYIQQKRETRNIPNDNSRNYPLQVTRKRSKYVISIKY